MPSFSLQLTNPQHDLLMLHRVLPLRDTIVPREPLLWVPVYALLQPDLRSQEALIVHVPFDRSTEHLVVQYPHPNTPTLTVRFNHGPASQHRPGAYPGDDRPSESVWTLSHLSLGITPDLLHMERKVRNKVKRVQRRQSLLRFWQGA